MEVHFGPELEKKLNDLAAKTGRGAGDLVQDAVAGYFEELSTLRSTLDGRYDDLESGRVQAIDGEDAFERLRAKSEARRNGPA